MPYETNILSNGYDVIVEIVYEGGGGSGVPNGGTTGQVLAKKSDLNGDVEWVNPSFGGNIDGGDANSAYDNDVNGGGA